MRAFAVLREYETPGRTRYRPILQLTARGSLVMRFRVNIWCRVCGKRVVQRAVGRKRELCRDRECHLTDRRRRYAEEVSGG